MTPITNCPATGKKRAVTGAYIIREPDGNLRTHFVVDCFEDDGITRAETVAPQSIAHLFRPREVQESTKGRFINTQTKEFKNTNLDGSGNPIPNVIAEKDFYNNIPCTSPAAPGVSNVGELLDFMINSAIQIAESNNKI